MRFPRSVSGEQDPYQALRRHLDRLPVGFPATLSGVEIRILKALFEPEEARAALGLSWRFRTSEEALAALGEAGVPCSDYEEPGLLDDLYRRMARKGSILWRQSEGRYALLPFVVGMYELQLKRLTKEFVEDTNRYFVEGYGLEYISTGEAQTRVIPIQESLRPGNRIASYEEFRWLIEGAGDRIAVIDCVCRRAADLLGKPCKATDRRELCMVFRDYADTMLREGWGRRLSRDEALALVEEDLEEGLVLRPSNEEEPQFLCACCGDCCGLISIAKALPRPADYVASNWRARVDAGACIGCGLCARRCPMEAIEIAKGDSGAVKACVMEHRCIGCGVCAPRCPTGAIALEPREAMRTPPPTTEALLEALRNTRPGRFRRLARGARAILGIRKVDRPGAPGPL